MVKQPWMVPLFHTFTYGGIYMEKKTENIRISLTDSIILMLVIIAEIVFCVRGGLNLAVPLLLTWLIISCTVRSASFHGMSLKDTLYRVFVMDSNLSASLQLSAV